MSHFTSFAGLTELDPGDPITANGAVFTNEDPGTVDYYLRIGTVTHRHDAHPNILTPTATPTVSVDAAGGQIGPDTQVYAAYTIIDPDGGETMRSAATLVTTGTQASEPTTALTAVFDSSGGSLPVGQYAYAITLNDSTGGESTIGPAAFMWRQPGFASGQAQLSGLAQEVDGTQWVSWNLWRAQDGGDFQLIATGQSDSFTDTGLICTDASRTPPIDMTGVGATYALNITLPTPTQDPSINGQAGGPSGVSMNLYLSLDGTFTNPCLYGSFPVASGGTPFEVTQLTLKNGAPPPVSRSLPGAQKIDPDTELLDFPWKRPVPTAAALPSGGNTDGDTRIAANTKVLWTWDEPTSTWKPIQGSGGGGGGGSLLVTDDTTNVSSPDTLEFVGAGGTTIAVSNPAPGTARVTVTGGGGGGTGGGGTPGPTGGQPGGTFIGWQGVPEDFNYPDNTPFTALQPPGEWGEGAFDTGGTLYVLGSAAVASGGGFETRYWATQQPADAQVQATVGGCQAGTTAMGLWNRMKAFAMDGYLLQVEAGVATLSVVSAGAFTTLGSTFTVADGDTIMLRCQGTTISAFRNGVQQVSVTDSTWNGTSSQIGVRGFNDGTHPGSLDHLWARDLNGSLQGPVAWADPVATLADLPAVGGVYVDGALILVEDTGDLYQWSAIGSFWNLYTVGGHGNGSGFVWGPMVNVDFTDNTVAQAAFATEGTYFAVDGNTGHIMVMANSGNPVTDLNATRMAGIPDVNEGTPTDYTPSLANAGDRYIGQSNAAQNFHLPPFSSVPWPLGTVFTIVQYGTGPITVVADTGVTLRVPSTHTAATRAQYSTIELLQINQDEWVVSGDMA